tara:strand:- start:13231 stop:15240 length:2010 start_codon:yes stop_codon:yes gene_type:complete
MMQMTSRSLLVLILLALSIRSAQCQVFSEVRIDKQGNLVFDGKPVFAAGWWAAQEVYVGQFYSYLTGCRIVNRSGVNPFFYLRDYGDVTGQPDVNVMKEFARNVDDEPLMNLRTDAARKQGAIDLNVTARNYKKKHPGCLALTVLAPAEPSPRHWTEFIGAVNEIDIWVVDPYVGASANILRRKPVAWVQDYVRQMMVAVAKSNRPERPVWCLLQGFDSSDATGMQPGRRFIYPTPRENRATAFLAIVEGARGVQWFRYQNGRGRDFIHESAPDLAESIRQVCLEIARLQPVLSLPEENGTQVVTPLVTEPHPGWGRPYDVGVHVMQKYLSGQKKSYIIAVNSGSLTRFDQVKIPLHPRVAGGVARVLSEGREAQIVEGQIVDDFAPMAVHLYEVGELPTDRAVVRFDFESDRQPARQDGRGRLFDGTRYKMTYELAWDKVREESYGGQSWDWLTSVSNQWPSYTRDVPAFVPGNQKAVRFTGQEALQFSDRSADLGPWTTFTLDAWFKLARDVSERGAAHGVSQSGTILRLSSWSRAHCYRDGQLPNVAGMSVSSSGRVAAEWCNVMGGSSERQRLELPQLVADGKFHHVALVRRPSQDPEVMQIGLILDGQHEAWITDASDGQPIAFNQGTQPDWEIRNTVGGRWRESRVSNGFHGVIDQIEITATR